jgi:hypothetical protein
MKKLTWFILAAYILTFPSLATSGLPTTRSGGQSDALSTTFDFRAPYSQVTKTSGTAGLLETGNYQLLKNPSFEATTYSSNWTASGGTLAAATSTNIFYGKSATWDSSASSQTLTTDAITVPEGFKGNNCEASIYVKVPSGTATHTLQAWDGTNVLATATVVNSAYFTKNTVTFPCPTSGTIALRLVSVASDEPLVALDEGYLGLARNVGTVAQAVFKGSVLMTGCTDWTRSNGTFDNFAATSGCTYTVDGDVLAPSTVIPGFRLQNVAPGRYLIIARGFFGKNISTTNADASFRFSDGSTTFSEQVAVAAASASGQAIGVGEITGSIGYTTAQSTLTIQVQGKVSSTASSTAALIRDDGGSNAGTQINGLTFEVYYFPTSAQTVVMPDAQGWWAAGYISGASVSLGTTAVTTYQEATNGSLSLTPDSGSAPMGITCSSTNAAATPSTGATTCSAGNESLGFSVNVPRAGRYEVCGQFGHNVASSAGDAGINVAFEWVNTATNSQTIVARMGPRTTSGHYNNPASGQSKFGNVTACGQVTLSAGVTAFRLFYEQSIPGTNGPSTNVINIDADPNIGDRAMRVTMRPITGEQQAILANSVSTFNQNGSYAFGAGVTAADCTSTPCTLYDGSTPGVTITRASTGVYSLNYAGLGITKTPTCAIGHNRGSGEYKCDGGTATTTSQTIFCYQNTTGSTWVAVDSRPSAVCFVNR